MRALLLLLFALLALGLLHFYLLDGLDGWFFSLSGEEATYYSESYSDRGFRQVRIGMSEEDVLAILGEPLSRYSPPDETQTSWQYSGRRVDASYRERVIIFERGRVTRRISEYYVD
jgi:SmpA / OmlA family